MISSPVLGEGTFSRVELVSREIALKKFHTAGDFCAIREIAILNAVNHASVISISSVSMDTDGCRIYMRAYPMTLDSPEYKAHIRSMPVVIYNVLQAVAHLHCLSIYHRDIKPANILFDPSDNKAVLCDFNISVFVIPGMNQFYGRVQSLYYRAPEIDFEIVSSYGPGIDVYSIGAIAFELAAGTQWIRKEALFCAADNAAVAFGLSPRHNHSATYTFIKAMTVKQACAFVNRRMPGGPVNWLNFCARLLHPDPAKRLTSEQAVDYSRNFINPTGEIPRPASPFVLVAEPAEIKKSIDDMTARIDPGDHQALLLAEQRLIVKASISNTIGEFYRKWVRIIEIKYYSAVNRKKIYGSSEDFDIFCAAIYIIWACTGDTLLEISHVMRCYNRAIDVMSTIDWKPL